MTNLSRNFSWWKSAWAEVCVPVRRDGHSLPDKVLLLEVHFQWYTNFNIILCNMTYLKHEQKAKSLKTKLSDLEMQNLLIWFIDYICIQNINQHFPLKNLFRGQNWSREDESDWEKKKFHKSENLDIFVLTNLNFDNLQHLLWHSCLRQMLTGYASKKCSRLWLSALLFDTVNCGWFGQEDWW